MPTLVSNSILRRSLVHGNGPRMNGLGAITVQSVEGVVGIGLMTLGAFNLVLGSRSGKRKGRTLNTLLDVALIFGGFAVYSYSGESLSNLITGVQDSSIAAAVGL
jgi:hypothetical protein